MIDLLHAAVETVEQHDGRSSTVADLVGGGEELNQSHVEPIDLQELPLAAGRQQDVGLVKTLGRLPPYGCEARGFSVTMHEEAALSRNGARGRRDDLAGTYLALPWIRSTIGGMSEEAEVLKEEELVSAGLMNGHQTYEIGE
ncbi:hypothetical protein PG997_014715 [Apiospora hydei]|uniref:Uncharacterized protein n=1 Tax=Apiospora hydei TaxID=1337664 RepID=A0ABR1UUN0_9PEZI